MRDPVISKDQLDTYADRLCQRAPTLREQAVALPPELDGPCRSHLGLTPATPHTGEDV